jgi:hypothetical protein
MNRCFFIIRVIGSDQRTILASLFPGLWLGMSLNVREESLSKLKRLSELNVRLWGHAMRCAINISRENRKIKIILEEIDYKLVAKHVEI